MEQRHQPLAFLGAKSKSAEERWSTFEKEGFAIYQAFKRMDCLFAAEESTYVFTDHRNLLFVYYPLALEPTLGRHVVHKGQRWALFLSKFGYIINHVRGEDNVMPDILTRWMSEGKTVRLSIRCVSGKITERDILQSPLDDAFQWPDIGEMSTYAKDKSGRIMIPEDDIELQIKLIVIAHCGAGGHRGHESTYNILKEHVSWHGMKDDCYQFVRSCVHCLSAKGGLRIPRPLSSTLHGTLPNEVAHFDYLYMGPGISGYKYLLIIEDDLGAYAWLQPTVTADAVSTATELARWVHTFSAPKYWVSDQASHFKNEVMQLLAADHNINHKFTVAYSAWVNGTVENLMQHVMAACRALLSELRLAPMDWPDIVSTIMQALNEAPTERLGRRKDGVFRCPLEVMTGISPRRMDNFTVVRADHIERLTIKRTAAEQIMKIDKLQRALEEIHKDVEERVADTRAKPIARHNADTHVVAPDFSVGDYVLVRRAQNKGHKMAFRWLGPRRVTKSLGETVFEITGILDGKVETIHAARLMLYRGDMDGHEVSQKLIEHIQHSEARYEMIEKLLDIGEAEDGVLIQVEWMGLPDKCDWTWQEVNELYEDVPDKLVELVVLENTPKQELAQRVRAQLAIKTSE